MQQEITGYHQDEETHWVAQLACGHFQHVRHDPPWSNREWVLSSRTRDEKLGLTLNCIKCDIKAPKDKQTPQQSI